MELTPQSLVTTTLGPTEEALLRVFAASPRKILDQETLMNGVWGKHLTKWPSDPYENLCGLIRRVRRKLVDEWCLPNRRGQGWILEPTGTTPARKPLPPSSRGRLVRPFEMKILNLIVAANGEWIDRDRIEALVWHEPPATASAIVASVVSRMRKLGYAIETKPKSRPAEYRIVVPSGAYRGLFIARSSKCVTV